MTHHDALERSRRMLHSEPECHRQLLELGPDPELALCTAWACLACQTVLVIDPVGVIRDRRPLGEELSPCPD